MKSSDSEHLGLGESIINRAVTLLPYRSLKWQHHKDGCTAARSACFHQATASLGQGHQRAEKVSAIFIQYSDDLWAFHRGEAEQFFAFLKVSVCLFVCFSWASCILEPREFDPVCLPSDLKENFRAWITLMQIFRGVLRCVLKDPGSYSTEWL